MNNINVGLLCILLFLAAPSLADDIPFEWSDSRGQRAIEAAIEKGDPSAMRTMGWRYANAVGVPHNMVKARQYWHKAASLGDSRSLVFLAAGTLHRDWRSPVRTIDRELLKEALDRNEPIAHVALGIATLYGLGGAKDPIAAVGCYETAAKLGSCYAMGQLALMYRDGVGVAANQDAAGKWAARAIDRSKHNGDSLDICDIYQMGVIYSNGIGTDRSSREAIAWWGKGAAAGDTACMWALGSILFESDPLSVELAITWWKKAAEAGNTDALASLASTYEKAGKFEEALAALVKASELGDTRALASLSGLYASEANPKKDRVLARQLMNRAAEAGHAGAMIEVASWYANGNGVPQDLAMAAQWLLRSAARGDVAAMNQLGFCYLSGLGVEQDVFQSIRWFRQAAEDGNPHAMNNLGTLYDKGIAVKRDAAAAFRWFQLAANKGSIAAMTSVGVLYSQGDGVRKDLNEARKWFERSHAAGDTDATHNLGIIYAGGMGVKSDTAKAAAYFRAAANKGYVNSMYNLAILLEQGNGVNADMDLAVSWMRKAAAKGHSDAKQWLAKHGHKDDL